MAANKFATMLHRNTNKITLILVYAFLEWILIFSLLLNSLFSYLIIKYAEYFGLKKPCLWCCRLDHLIDSKKNKKSYRDLVCDAHAKEISKLGFCPNHQKLSESQDMCEDCSSSSQQLECPEFSRDYAFFPWMKKIGLVQGPGEVAVESGGLISKCSCCGVSSERNFYSPCVLVKPPWEVLDFTQKGNLIKEAVEGDGIDDGDHFDQSRSELVSNQLEDEQRTEENRGVFVEGTELEAEKNCSGSVSNDDRKDMAANGDEKFDVLVEKEQESIKEEELNALMNNPSCDQSAIQVSYGKESSPEIGTKHLEFYIYGDDCHLIPVEFIDPATPEKKNAYKFKEVDQGDSGNEDVILDFTMHDVATQVELDVENKASYGEAEALVSGHANGEEIRAADAEDEELNESEWSAFIQAEVGQVKEKEEEEHEQVAVHQMVQILSTAGEDDVRASAASKQMTQILSNDGEDYVQLSAATKQSSQVLSTDGEDYVQESDATEQTTQILSTDGEDYVQESDATAAQDMESDANQVCDDVLQMQSDETDAEISIGTEIPDHEPIDDLQTQDDLPSSPCKEEGVFAGSSEFQADNYDHGFRQSEDDVEFTTIVIETSDKMIHNHLSSTSELNENEEEKVPDTPTSTDSLRQLHKKLLLLDRRESGTEESLDGGSVISDIDADDGALTVDKLKSALKAQRKALNVLYAELEEERSASAIAANQTMAMINRLQEEKAAMQMEALQYQRMMDEQSEYDQEALQLLNEIMVKREKEKAEVEKELEIYRKKVQDYEAKEKMQMLRRRSRTPSASYSNEDSDGVSVDLSHEAKEDESFEHNQESSNQHTPADAVLYLEESLASFEDERISILEQLKVLEEKLFTLNDEEEHHYEDIKSIDHLHQQNGTGYNEDHESNGEPNGVAANGHFEQMNGKHDQQDRKYIGAKAKRLLPLFDEIGAETENGILNGNHELDYDSVASQNSVAKFELDNKRLAIEEEVDHVYERLQALEADREFLKHCMRSLRKGDKGIYLLQEILQHLRDLRNVEVRARTMADAAS